MSDTPFTTCPSSAPAYPFVAQVCAHWSSLRAPHALPRRAALDPTKMSEALPHVFLAEYVSASIVRLRLCGHEVEELMGMDLRGMPLTALFAADARADLMAALKIVGRGARATLSLRGEPGFGQPDLEARLALMPLTDADGRITHVLGVLERRGRIGRRPRRLICAQDKPVVTDTPPSLRVINGGKR